MMMGNLDGIQRYANDDERQYDDKKFHARDDG
jgi:hypothetical protein